MLCYCFDFLLYVMYCPSGTEHYSGWLSAASNMYVLSVYVQTMKLNECGNISQQQWIIFNSWSYMTQLILNCWASLIGGCNLLTEEFKSSQIFRWNSVCYFVSFPLLETRNYQHSFQCWTSLDMSMFSQNVPRVTRYKMKYACFWHIYVVSMNKWERKGKWMRSDYNYMYTL